MTEHVAVVIVGYRCGAEIRRCIEALARSTHSAFEVHVCENGGSDSYRALVEEISGGEHFTAAVPQPARSQRAVQAHMSSLKEGGQSIFLHESHDNSGYAGGINLALDVVAPDSAWSAIWVLNPDTEPHRDALAQLVEYARDETYGIVGARLILAETGRVQLYGGRWRRWMARGFNIGLDAPGDAKPDIAAIEAEMDYVSGASMYVPRRYIEAVGPLDERYFLYNEEVDWCFRRGRYRLGYAHDAIVYHTHGVTMGSSHDKKQRSPLSVFLDERNKLLFTRRFFPREYPIVIATTLILTGQYLAAGAFSNFFYALAGWGAGLTGRSGRPNGFPFGKPKRDPTAGSRLDDVRSSVPG